MPTRLRLRLAALLLGAAAPPAGAQFVSRPHLDWRTTETEHFAVHYPAQYREWTLAVVERLESARSVVGEIVGYAPQRVQVLVDDPLNAPNGFALPFLDRPTMVFFPIPPTPRQSIGNSRDWGELLAVHEYAHLAHLARPSRRSFEFGRLLPVPVSPILRRTPRWAVEGYATYVEGRVTGSGRPHNAHRAAVLRQWALDGRLPTYAQMSGWSAYQGGAFAYLMGSAYLEWLAAREGDSTITHLWRRMTARTARTFPQAFAGVYGRGPEELYGRFTTEVVGAALEVEQAVQGAGGVVAGELVQRLAWETGDPALNGDGSRVALVLRSATRPGRVVVWRTGEDSIPPAVAAARDSARARARRRDPEDVPDRQFFPPPKRAVAVLEAREGRPFDAPRFMPDGEWMLVSRAEPLGDGAYRPDLHLWEIATGAVRRVTHGAGVRQADPEPDGRTAVAVQCLRGWCDLVRVDLGTGVVTMLREGSPAVSYFRPRVSPSGEQIAVAEQRDDQWRIVLVDARAPERASDPLPRDGVNRFDVTWADSGRALLTVSEAGGIANLERIDLERGTATPITRVTGAAFAPAVDPVTGDVWFLSLHARGLDLRRLTGPQALVLPARPTALFPVLPVRPTRDAPPLASAPLPPEQPYGLGPRHTRWLPGLTADAAGATGQLLLLNGDPVGRLEAALLGAWGSTSGWRGGRAWLTSRRWRPALTGEAFAARQAPTAIDAVRPASLDVQLVGSALRVTGRTDRGAWRAGAEAGGSTMRLEGEAAVDPPALRGVGWLALEGAAGGRVRGTSLSAALRAHGDAGRHGSADVRHLLVSAAAAVDAPLLPIVRLAATVAHDAGDGTAAFERIAVGGAPAPLLDASVLPQRLAMPVLPPGALVGRRAVVARGDVGLGIVSPFVWAARVPDDDYRGWQRVAGIEARYDFDALPVGTLPRGAIVGGAGHSIDRPHRGRTTMYVSVNFRP